MLKFWKTRCFDVVVYDIQGGLIKDNRLLATADAASSSTPWSVSVILLRRDRPETVNYLHEKQVWTGRARARRMRELDNGIHRLRVPFPFLADLRRVSTLPISRTRGTPFDQVQTSSGGHSWQSILGCLGIAWSALATNLAGKAPKDWSTSGKPATFGDAVGNVRSAPDPQPIIPIAR